MKNNIKYYARFLVETATPLAIGSGEKGLEVDRLIIRDANGLPFIPGSSLAGVVRHEIEENSSFTPDLINLLFGYQKKESGQGSRIGFSPAKLTANDGKTAIECLKNIDFDETYYSWFNKLPERDHVRITEKGVAKDKGKFDEQVLHRGARFIFEIDLSGTEEDAPLWNAVLQTIHQPFFRIGAGTRNGFGKLKIKECKSIEFDLSKKEDLESYLNKSSSLNSRTNDWKSFIAQDDENTEWTCYKVSLTPENFFLFGGGFGDEDADIIQKTERCIDWADGTPKMDDKQKKILIPATSVKGALSHRTAYHFNKNSGKSTSHPFDEQKDVLPKFDLSTTVKNVLYKDDLNQINHKSDADDWNQMIATAEKMTFEDFKNKSTDWKKFQEVSEGLCSRKVNQNKPRLPTEDNNVAVKALFGFAKDDSEDSDTENGARGKVIFSDVYLDYSQQQEKVFSHVAIDRFTGGGIHGALFQEKAVTSAAFTLDVFVLKTAIEDESIKGAFESALDDLVSGNLQLGGNTAKGHGVFTGSYQAL